MGVWYTTRERVKAALDVRATARLDRMIDEIIEGASRSIDGHVPGGGCLHRRFYPQIDTRFFDWPTLANGRSWRLWLDADELISVSNLTAGGTVIAASDYLLRPDHGPPYTYIEIDRSSGAAFVAGDTAQRAIEITGLYGYRDDSAPAGALAEALDASETAVDVTDSSLIETGTIIKVDSERMIVTGRSSLDTGQNLIGTLAADKSVTTVPVASGAALAVGETILLDAERMQIVDIAGNNLVVIRAVDGTVLAAHTTSDVYAPRTLTVTRGALGTVAATHDTATAITSHLVPGPVGELCLGESLDRLLGRGSGWARTIGSGDNEREYGGKGLTKLRQDVYASYGRRARHRAV